MCLYVRAFTSVESRQVSAWLKKSQNGVQMRRAQILSFSAQGMKIQSIATQLLMNEEYLRELIRTFNNSGLEALKIRRSSGRPHILTEEEKSIVVEVATAPPQAYGRPFNQWSLRKLQQFLVEDTKTISPVSYEAIRQVLKIAKVSFQRTRTWKHSTDPDFDSKKNASQRSTRKPRKDP